MKKMHLAVAAIWESSKPLFTKIFKQMMDKHNQLRIFGNISAMTFNCLLLI